MLLSLRATPLTALVEKAPTLLSTCSNHTKTVYAESPKLFSVLFEHSLYFMLLNVTAPQPAAMEPPSSLAHVMESNTRPAVTEPVYELPDVFAVSPSSWIESLLTASTPSASFAAPASSLTGGYSEHAASAADWQTRPPY